MPSNTSSLQKGIYIFPEFSPGALFCFSTRDFEASKDLPFFLDAIGIPRNRFCTLEQVHGDRIIHVSSSRASSVPEADGMVTKERGLALVIRTADCLPVFFLDPDTPAVGICHAGWRGAKQGIALRTLETFQRSFQSNPGRLRVALGPSICPACYEVGGEFQEYFPGFVHRKGTSHFLDLKGAVRQQLTRGGVRPESIQDSSLCTACSSDRFFSARKEGIQTGRFLSSVVLK